MEFLMEVSFQNLILGFATVLTPTNLLYALLGCLIGTMVGVLPGVGPLAGIGSYAAGTLSVVGLMFLAPPLARFALGFGPPEYCSLLVCGLVVLSYMTGGSIVKNLSMITLGLMIGMIGIDQMTGYFRFSYGVT